MKTAEFGSPLRLDAILARAARSQPRRDAVIFDGTLTEAWPLAGPWIASQFPNPELLNFRDLMFRPSELRGDAALIGAATLPFLRLFSIGERASVGGTIPRTPARTAVGAA